MHGFGSRWIGMTNGLVDLQINVKIKLASLWVTVMLLYLYADLFGFFIPGHIDQIRAGELTGAQINQELLLGFMILMTIPGLMVFLSLTLKPNVNRWANIIVGILQIFFVLTGILDPNLFFKFASSIETVLLLLIIRHAWTWPTQEDSTRIVRS